VCPNRTGVVALQITEFGKTSTGTTVQSISISAGDLTANILTFGAIVQHVGLADVRYSLTLGSDRLSDYEGAMCYHGALIGPVANRIANARTALNGGALQFEPNSGSPHLLHSGTVGTHRKIWTIAETTLASVTLTLNLPDGEGGLPGNRHIRATYEIVNPATLRLTISASTDAPTLLNFANHSYWNLDGSNHWQGHSLHIAAEHFLPVTADLIPTGAIAPVEATPYDFRKKRALIPGQPPLDTNFCLSNTKTPLRHVATLTGKSGVALALATTEPGLQVYDAAHTARDGHAKYEGLAIEAQGWPDAPNHAAFPSITATPETPYSQTTEWQFTKP
jgi:aldose 1-epimerase